ncbi:MAG: glycerophosphodiester phosphodiesterase family protein [Clostridia bacterium]|nr:glycerophosphodiester phosphodiesterase family protein [Clostridia bacterium]
MKKFLCLFLIACMLIPTLIACTDTDSTDTSKTGTDKTTASSTTKSQEKTTPEEEDSYIDTKTAMQAVAEHYNIVYTSDIKGSYQAAIQLIEELEKHTETSLVAKKDTTPATSKREVLFGMTNREESQSAGKGITYYDYKIAVKNKKLLVIAGSTTAYDWAMKKLIDLLKNDELDFSTNSELLEKLPIPEDSLAFNFDSFTPTWLSKYKPADWMTNADGSNMMEKAYALTRAHNSDYRITSQTHRGDIPNYPEGSLESVASCIWAGIDVMEFDIQFTKDGVAILHHDDTLTRMTDANKYIGSEGYPTTTRISDWTYAQISTLRLKKGLGGTNAPVTNYHVPTLYEALLVTAGRIFIQIDDKNKIMSDSLMGFYPIAEATGSKICFITQFDPDRAYDDNANSTGTLSAMKKWLSYDSTDTELAEFITKLEGWLTTGDMRGEPCWPNPATNYHFLGDRSTHVEADSTWKEMTRRNYYHIWTENPIALATYIKNNYTAQILPE